MEEYSASQMLRRVFTQSVKTFARLRARAPAASARHRAAHEALSEAQASARSDATKLGRTEGIDPAEALGSPWTAEKAARSTDAPRSQTTVCGLPRRSIPATSAHS